MDNNTKTRAYSIISAVLFLFQALYQLISNIRYLNFWDILFVIITSAFAVILFIGKKNVSLIVVSSVMTLLNIFYIIRNISLSTILLFLTYASLTAIIILGIKNKDIVRNIFFIPSAIALIYNVMDFSFIIKYIRLIGLDYYFIHDILLLLLFNASSIASLFLVGLWISNPKVTNIKITAASQLNTSLIGGADKIKACKELLDAGIITQEEFEEKKKQILNS